MHPLSALLNRRIPEDFSVTDNFMIPLFHDLKNKNKKKLIVITTTNLFTLNLIP